MLFLVYCWVVLKTPGFCPKAEGCPKAHGALIEAKREYSMVSALTDYLGEVTVHLASSAEQSGTVKPNRVSEGSFFCVWSETRSSCSTLDGG